MARTTAIAMEIRTKELARRLLWGQPHSEIMGELGLTYAQFNNTIQTPAFREELRALQHQTYQDLDERFRGEMETVQSKARGESITAVDTLISLMKGSASENLKRDCANDIIKYSGQDDASKRPVIQINHATVNLIKQATKEDDERTRTIDLDAQSAA